MIAEYIGKNKSLGLIVGHIYDVTISKSKYGYEALITIDCTENKDIEKLCTYASKLSITRDWNEVK